jgi:hypothetical protein
MRGAHITSARVALSLRTAPNRAPSDYAREGLALADACGHVAKKLAALFDELA